VDESRRLSYINGTINHCGTYSRLRTVRATRRGTRLKRAPGAALDHAPSGLL
jgi:hypothetical protein